MFRRVHEFKERQKKSNYLSGYPGFKIELSPLADETLHTKEFIEDNARQLEGSQVG